jgi:hypothetical protein
LEVPLVCQQDFLPISKGEVYLDFVEVITPITHLGIRGLVTPIIATRFLLDGHPFLLGVIRANILGPLPFQVHLRWAHDLLPPIAQAPSHLLNIY